MTEREALSIVASLCADGVLDEKEEAILRKALAHPEHKKCENCGEFGECCQEQPEQEPTAVYGYCPECGAEGVARERRPNGNDCCANGHTYPSRTSNKTPQRTWVGLTAEEEFELDQKYGYDFNVYIDQRDMKLKEKNT